jgi:site-specific DNA recombinase
MNDNNNTYAATAGSTGGKRAITYGRVSYDDVKRSDGLNLQAQMEMCREYCQQKGYTIVAELAEDDRGASGADFDLPKLTEALEMARAGEADVLVVRELDRFARRLAKQLIVEGEFKRAKVDVEFILEEFDDTPEGQLQKNVRAVIAEYEREKINQRMTRGRRNKVKAGSTMFNRNPPYGYREVQDDSGNWMLVVVPEEARIVVQIFTWYVVGDGVSRPMTIAEIASRLSKMRVPTQIDTQGRANVKKRGVGVWARGTVWNMFKNETYAGRWTYADTGLEVSVPAIIQPELWNAAQARLAQNRANASRNLKHDYLFRRRVICGQCGLHMQGKSKRGKAGGHLYFYYRCPARARTVYVRDCDLPIFRVDQVDTVVWKWVKEKMSDPDELRKKLENHQAEQEKANAPLRERLGVVNDLIADNKTQLERLLDLYLSGGFTKEMLTERKVRLETTIDALESEQQDLTATLKERTLTSEEIQSLEEFAKEVEQAFVVIDDSDFEAKRVMIERLDVQVRLAVEDGLKVAYASSAVLGTSPSLSIVTTGSTPSARPTRRDCAGRWRWPIYLRCVAVG